MNDLLCRKGGGSHASFDTEEVAELDETEARGHRIVCAGCGFGITSDEHRVARSGRHDHHCVNPMGVHFHIGCFRSAPGCKVFGPPTSEHTWFPGYAWSYAVCGNCSGHLGWHFSGGDAAFFGLVLDRLADRDR